MEEKRTFRTYKMWHEVTPKIVYIGITTQPLLHRLFNHLSDADNNLNSYKRKNGGAMNAGKCMWIQTLVDQGFAPRITLIDTIYGVRKDAIEKENHWIEFFYLKGYILLNSLLPKQVEALVKGKYAEPVIMNYEIQSTENDASGNRSGDRDNTSVITDVMESNTNTRYRGNYLLPTHWEINHTATTDTA